MAYFTERQLRDYNLQYFSESTEKTLQKSASVTKNTAFLSYSHKDTEIAKGFRAMLQKRGIMLYVDLLDPDLGTNTNRETAIKVRQKIIESNYFFLLATNNSVTSKWMPWELGVADGHKDYNKILIIPVANDIGQSKGTEFVQVYKRIDVMQFNRPAIYAPSNFKDGVYIESYFQS